ncbi:MAG: MaoC family dehydratase [Panacagrimonas sp.]
MTETLLKFPNAAGLYLGALRTARRKPGKEVRVPNLSVKLAAIQADARRLASYREICGFEPGADLPITFPQVQAAPLHMWLMLRPQFPLPLMGLVHLRNRFEMLAPMPVDGSYDISASLEDGRRTHQGMEVDLLTEYRNYDNELVYRAVMTALYRMKSEGRPQRPKPTDVAGGVAEYRSFEVPADIGRRYAPIGGDFNPIHLYALTAKAFGFPRAIAHGMWSLARASALIEQAQGRGAKTLSVQFRQPLLLPAKVSLKFSAGEAGHHFALLSRSSDKTHFVGHLA